MARLSIILYLIQFICPYVLGFEVKAKDVDVAKKGRAEKLLPLFTIVTFPNDPCNGNANKNGTCYTAEECIQKGGTNEGSCAQGYGVCCTFTISCGGQASENCTYFESSGTESGACRAKVCKCSSDICQLRLDFNSFVINGPSTDTLSATSILGGQAVSAGGAIACTATQCLCDSFSVTNGGNSGSNTICGTNTGEHMYVDASDLCNELVFQLCSGGTTSRNWNIKVTQYSCDYPNLAPDGCTQYFFGETTGTVQSYNFEGGTHLANQNQNMCIRRERGICKICWSPTVKGDFDVSGKTNAAITAMQTGTNKASLCCGYGADGKNTAGAMAGYDCVTIPGAVKNTVNMNAVPERICGRKFVTVGGNTMVSVTVCSTRAPFSTRFISDNWEYAGADAAAMAECQNPGKGVKLGYELVSC